ncbi:protein CHLOROPLAST IMPORT APPARATUS 2 [Sesamum angolense]|uniref:Protein CHLOROPLAST IMPORT APPARATUS 2 n=1 Tax=Sesamum angolense TaxID=2727404 RepID=A0AAE2BPI4_9LAMI|nr:protein CHLOROPLAST IMPORT APPARATUS 2 [Sesamum angolense]
MNNKRRPKPPKSRPTPKKPKFLSLSLQFPPAETKKTRSLTDMRQSSAIPATNSHQLNLFPLQPQNQVEERENHEHENVAYFFSAADGGLTTLTGLLDTATVSNSTHTTNDSSRLDDLSPSASLTHVCRRQDSEELVRNALRSRERESSEEKWVCYSEVVERKVKEEEVTSSVVDLWRGSEIQGLSLKLDYEEILNAWSDKGPFYVRVAESSQIVPDITHDFLNSHEIMSNHRGRQECILGVVPEIDENGEMRIMGGNGNKREASVLRYKEKRQKRLFSKKIRYQVRKINAEKRPRLKGRFVKRS